MTKARFFDGIDWSRAWYFSILPSALRIINAANWRAEINQCAAEMVIHNHRNIPIQFIEQDELPTDTAYESHISTKGKIPTRENLHDFFNALVWLSFPKTKCQLNAMQAEQIDQLGIGKSRGTARDAATIFDENSAIVIVQDDAQGQAWVKNLRNHQWKTVLKDQSDLFDSTIQVWLFGHALMEKLVQPYKAITAHTLIVFADNTYFKLHVNQQRSWVDEHVSEYLKQNPLHTSHYTPLPVLGIPQWHEHQDDEFYSDSFVFRPKRIK